MILRYSELIQYPTFEERLNYLKLRGSIGATTFGFDRYLNQQFYQSKEWKDIRDHVIVRDNACDLGIDGYDIGSKIYIHHMNPITTTDISESTEYLLNPEYLICVSYLTHTSIHYGNSITADDIKKQYKIVERRKNDTCPWRIN